VAGVTQGELLWEPRPDARATSRMGRFLDWAEGTYELDLSDHEAAWRWSVDDLGGFWDGVVRYFDLPFHTPAEQVLPDASMPGARWFPGARLNYAELALFVRDDHPAIMARSQTRGDVTLTRHELAEQVSRAVTGLERLGVRPGDRVVGYLPNIPETIVAFLACAAIGAIWSSCAPEFGVRSVIDRVEQIGPTVLLAVDGYRYGARVIERHEEVAEIRAALPTLTATVVLPYLHDEVDRDAFGGSNGGGRLLAWDELTDDHGVLTFASLPFDHPLYVLYSSGTTGLPKAIVHGHGGIMVEHVKMLALHHDLGPEARFFWFTTTGWMMWNYLVSGLLVGTTVVLFDGDPGHPDLMELWRLAADLEVTLFGVSAPFVTQCRKAGLAPGSELDLSALRSVGSTGAPLPVAGFGWVYEHVKQDQQLASVSGGTDVCTPFVGSSPLLPVYAGEISGRCLGAKVEAFDEQANPVVGRRGELVLTAPMPSMPVGFWNDPDGSRYRAAYFEDFPGVWRHGDWIEITDRGTCIITGRSDATLKRGGVRMGTAEFYSVVEHVDGVVDSLVVHHEDPDGGPGELVLFVVLAEGVELDDDRRRAIFEALRHDVSPRHVPDVLHAVPAVPRTISGKKMEVPVKRLLEGEPLARVANPGAMANPDSLDAFVALADPDR
jgi:acetoacetyl-CoA synthetase